jgi:hypothetical protein|tara:strand:- start:503 stop:682 length:180 start_codon:yes stop_codon:yes gene_type:complete
MLKKQESMTDWQIRKENRQHRKEIAATALRLKKEAERPHSERHPNDHNIPKPDRCVNYE